MQAAAGNEYHGKDIIALLLEKRGDDVQITEDVVEAAAGNEYSAHRRGQLGAAGLWGKA